VRAVSLTPALRRLARWLGAELASDG
jgi:hypothetical protein